MSIHTMKLNKTQVNLGYNDLVFTPSCSDSDYFNSEVIYESSIHEHAGECYTEIDVPAISLQFTGPNAIEAINILIEDLQKIKRALKRRQKEIEKEGNICY